MPSSISTSSGGHAPPPLARPEDRGEEEGEEADAAATPEAAAAAAAATSNWNTIGDEDEPAAGKTSGVEPIWRPLLHGRWKVSLVGSSLLETAAAAACTADGLLASGRGV